MQLNLMKRAAIGSVIFSIAAMAIILYLSAGKVIVISDVAQDEMQGHMSYLQKEGQSMEQVLSFASGEADTSYLRIPLPQECKAENIVIENHYMNQELCIIIDGVDSEFYEDNVISGNRDGIIQGSYEKVKDGIKLKFMLTDIFEYRTILENNDLYISFLSPREMYDKIVVIDPACGGSNNGYAREGLKEKEINLQIAQKLKEKLDKTDIKAYYTRMDDVNPSESDRVKLANGTRADMYIRIQMDADDDPAIYGTTAVYNGDYFIPSFGSVELADLLEREVVTSIKGKALGLDEAGQQEYVIRHVTIPAAAVRAGHVTNKQEAILLGREDYQDKIASGIYNAIMKAYEDAE